MLKKLLLLLFAVNLVSCSDDDSKPHEEIGDGSFMEFYSDGVDRKITFGNYQAEHECNYIFVSGGSLDPENRYDFSFQLTDTGQIVRLRFTELTDTYRYYGGLDFDPASTFTISNFNYDPAVGDVYFEFEGYLYEQKDYHNADELVPKHISGKILHKNTQSDECSYFPLQVFIDNADINFIDWKITSSIVGYNYQFFGNNGYRLHILSENDIHEVELDNYGFTSDSPIHIKLFKYIGPQQNTIAESWNQEDWEVYNCEGTIEINGQHQHPMPHTTGTFILDAFDVDGNLVFDDLSGSFEM